MVSTGWCNGAPCLSHNLKETFPGRSISRLGDLHWPVKSPDLTVLGFFLWGSLKSQVYVNEHQTGEAL